MSSIYLNAIFVIESLQTEELKTGKKLFDDVISKYAMYYEGFKTNFFQVNSKDEFFLCLQKIVNQVCNESIYPIIHIECHGDEKKKGFIINPTKELILWKEIAIFLRTINVILKNSLFVTLGVCNGSFLQLVLNPEKPAPFFGLVAPVEETFISNVQQGFDSFFKTLLFEQDLIKASNAITKNSDFGLYTSEDSYDYFFEKELLLKIEEEPIKSEIRQYVLRYIRDQKSDLTNSEFEKYHDMFFGKRKEYILEKYRQNRNQFLMVDKYPEISKRFKLPKYF